MSTSCRVAFGTLVLAAVASTPVRAMMEADKFIGAWRLVSAQFRTDDGELAPSPYGDEPQGLLVYDAQGVMSAQLAQKNRAPFAIADRLNGTPEEIEGAFATYQAYWGRYRIDEREHVVTHTVIQALFPNWVGTEQRRHYKFVDDRLQLRTPPVVIGGEHVTGVLLWEKVTPNSQ